MNSFEISFLNKIEKQKEKHRLAQQKHRDKIASNPDYKQTHNEYMRTYNQKKRQIENDIKSKYIEEEPKTISLKTFLEPPPKVDKRSRKYKKTTTPEDVIQPSYLNRKTPLEYSTIDTYIKKADLLHRFFTKKSLSQTVKAELRKLLNDNTNIDEVLILTEMSYLKNDIEPTIQQLRKKYKNDNTFRSYINILTVISSHLKSVYDAYQILSKVNIQLNKDIQTKRKDNIVAEHNKDKIIDIDKEVISDNLKKLKNINDMLVFGLYTLFPSRRLEWRNVKITTETDINKLKQSDDTNFLIVSTSPKTIVFNDFKTLKTYGKQDFPIEDKTLDDIIDKYIIANGLSNNDYLFSLLKDKRQVISQSNFSRKVSDVFYKVYNIPISIRFLRQSWSSYIHRKNLSGNELEKITTMMAHSLEESVKYKIINK